MKKLFILSIVLIGLSACASSKLMIVKDCIDTQDSTLKVCKPL